ncbi:pseudouridine synthase [Sinorhizobium saheli]|uniref:Pseudouridine synthase n=1 Tax=Sinorhizobium saheli TaxID=36856 RepID=A0A178YC51_SINSA|nr:pseudouridine synthase [Sinorhizobium saheli]MQW87353.1 pseudouridine synthase [Sinorhizobium saheli]OAP44882.1 pseudouridine synthase [Sinorhizobium saheli]
MTSKDKPTKPGGKAKGRDRKPHASAGKGAAPAFADRSAAPAAGADEPQRISKILSRAGVASRRDVERMIMEGRVRLNGVVLDTPVVNATLADRIEVDGHPIRGIERTRLWLYHKPAGLVTTNADPEGRPTVFDSLPDDLPRVLSVGRLDINTEGLLLLTNDGGLARVLELPSTGWLRRYRVRAHGEIDQADLDRLKEGIAVDGVLYGAIEATLDRVQGSNVWITMGLREGKNREIKNVLGALGLDVNRLIRISYGPFQLGDLPEGHVQEIRGRTLRDQLGPRLIADAKANFDAPIYNDQPVAAEAMTEAAHAPDQAKPERGGRREKPEDKRARALSRLDTRRDDGHGHERAGRGRAKSEERPSRAPVRRSRASNVWMAPGARPVVEKKPKAAEDDLSPKAARRAPAETKRSGRSKDGAAKAAGSADAERKGRPGKSSGNTEARGRGFERRRPLENAERKSRDHGDNPPRRGERAARADSRAETARPPRGEGKARPGGEGKARPGGEKARAKPAGGKPAGAKSSAPRSSAPRGKPGGGKPGSGKPVGRNGGKPRKGK